MMKATTLLIVSVSLLNLTSLCMYQYNQKQINREQYDRRIAAKKLTKKNQRSPETQLSQRNNLNPTLKAVAPNPDKKK